MSLWSTGVLALTPSLWWPLDVTSGATDQSGNARNGTGAGGISIGGHSATSPGINGESATCTDFDGTDDAVTSTYSPFTNGTSRTFLGWAYRDTSTTGDEIWGRNDEDGLSLSSGSNDVTFTTFGGGAETDTWTGAWPGNATWTFWALVFNETGDTAALYINGALVSSQAHTGTWFAGANFRVGINGGVRPFDGKQAHVAIFESGLSGANILDLYQRATLSGSYAPPITLGPQARPPLELAVETTDANGTTYLLDANGRAENRPTAISFGTKRGDGFASGGWALARDITLDYPDIGLKNDVRFIGADGSVAYEGRVASTPRSFGEDGHSISLSTAGWMTYAKQRKFSEVYIDRDLSHWGEMSLTRRGAVIATYDHLDGPSVKPDVANSTSALFTGWTGKWTHFSLSEGWYDAGPGVLIGAAYLAPGRGVNVSTGDANWTVRALASDDDAATTTEATSNFHSAYTATYFTPTTPRRYLAVQHFYSVSGAGGGDGLPYESSWQKLAVYGNHGLTRRGSDPGGFYASDVIKNIVQRFCPKLSTAGVQDTTYVIPHLVFERAFPFDAFLEINKYHLWDLGVWENKTLKFGPTDLTDYDWELRLDDPGVTVEFQGDTTEDLFNGIVVTYQDVDTGKTETLTPDDNASLGDTSINNPANLFGEDEWDEATISVPTNAAGAVQIGRTLLAEKNSPKSPGVYRVKGHIKDRAGHWQQVWRVRAGDTVSITSSTSLSDRPHLIVETQYDHDSYTLTISVDNTLPRVDAILDRFGVALGAANLT